MNILLYGLGIYFFIGFILIFIITSKNKSNQPNSIWLKYITYFIIVFGFYFLMLNAYSYAVYLFYLIFLIALLELVLLIKKVRLFQILIAIFLLSLCLVFNILFLHQNETFAIYTLFIVVIFDGFCQLVGQLIGKHKLVPRISPNKTIEGLIGGLTIATISSLLFLNKIESVSSLQLLVFTVLICVGAFLGDIGASKIKRIAGIKDFGNYLPGHGGILDRFDSWIGAICMAQLFLMLAR